MTTMNKTNAVAKRIVSLAAVVAIFAGLSLPQAQAAFMDDFESGYADGADLQTQSPWFKPVNDGINGTPNLHTKDGAGHDGSGGFAGWGAKSENSDPNLAARLHGDCNTTGCTLQFSTDFLKTQNGNELKLYFTDKDRAVDFIGANVQLDANGSVAFKGGGHGSTAGIRSGTGTFDTNEWYKITYSHVIGGGVGNTTLRFESYTDSDDFTYTSSIAHNEPSGVLDAIVILNSRDGATFDNVEATGIVPEPTSAILWALGMISMLGYCRRNR